MSVTITFIQDEERLDISMAGNLDVTVWQDICGACRQLPPSVKTCIVDLTRIRRVFDSGMAILDMLYWQMINFGATIIFLSDDSNIKKRILGIAPLVGMRFTLLPNVTTDEKSQKRVKQLD